jgi:hypothetical protein
MIVGARNSHKGRTELRGSGQSPDGEVKAHNESIHVTDWDCIVLDEYHFGAWRDNARELYDPADKTLAEEQEPDEEVTEEDLGLSSAQYLYLSGTPFRAITNGEFTEDATFDWTYVDEQAAKEHWDAKQGQNPYLGLPKMEMYAYEIAPGAANWAEDGEFMGFSLADYFKSDRVSGGTGTPGPGDCVFEDPGRVSEFLEMLRGKLSEQIKVQIVAGQKPPFPYESPSPGRSDTRSGICPLSRPVLRCATCSTLIRIFPASRWSSPPAQQQDRAPKQSRR